LWIQYAELGGATNQGLSPIDLELNGRKITTALLRLYYCLEVLDGDMPQYIADNTDDEISHHRFLNNYLVSKGAQPIDLSRIRNLAAEQSNWSPTKRTAYQSEATDRRHYMVDTVTEAGQRTLISVATSKMRSPILLRVSIPLSPCAMPISC